jgi:hypothetical protein
MCVQGADHQRSDHLLARPSAALAATATELVPIARCGEPTATTYKSSGTARIEPPPPTRPREKPTAAPEATARPSWSSLAARYQIRAIPTLMLFSKGRMVAQRAGAVDGRTLELWLNAHVVSG